MKSLLLLVTMLIAAHGGSAGEHDPMTSNYQSFSAPFDPKVPPVYPASIINDEFRAQSPVIDAPGTRKFVSLDPKWGTFVPGVGSTLAAQIDPTRQMCQLSGVAPKQWSGIMQDLPVPALTDEFGIGYQLVTRILPGWNLSNGDWGSAAWGLLLGDTMRSNPEASQLWSVLTQMQLSSGQLTGESVTAFQPDYSLPFLADGESQILPFQFLMAEVFSVQTAPDVFESQITFGVSMDGTFYQKLFQYADLPVALRQFALAFQTAPPDPGMGVFVDFFRYFPIVPGDSVEGSPFVGEVLQLGSV